MKTLSSSSLLFLCYRYIRVVGECVQCKGAGFCGHAGGGGEGMGVGGERGGGGGGRGGAGVCVDRPGCRG